MDNNKILRTKHLYSRAGFGIHYDQLNTLSNLSVKKLVDGIFKDSSGVKPINIIDVPDTPKDYSKLPIDEKRQVRRKASARTRALSIYFLNQLGTSRASLREKMTLFFHGHFACRGNQNPLTLQTLNNIQREHALGNFKTLTTEVSKSRAMLAFLNNQQNRKGRPNENFARELMELFTLGIGNYTEEDVKASARAFTGWMYNGKGEFVFRQNYHDDGEKTFFGKTGKFNGDDIISMIFEKKEAAYFIVGKLYKFFVNETVDEGHVKELGDYFYSKNYELEPLLKKMFTSNWFYDQKNVGNKIKSPTEFIVGLNKQFYIEYEKPAVLYRFQQALGQSLFYPPNVAGWSGGKDYIDSSSLMLRLKIPSTVINNGVIEFEGKVDPDDEAFIANSKRQSNRVAQQVKANVNWDRFANQIPSNISKKNLAAFLLQVKVDEKLLNDISESADLKTKVVQILSTPEYQMC